MGIRVRHRTTPQRRPMRDKEKVVATDALRDRKGKSKLTPKTLTLILLREYTSQHPPKRSLMRLGRERIQSKSRPGSKRSRIHLKTIQTSKSIRCSWCFSSSSTGKSWCAVGSESIEILPPLLYFTLPNKHMASHFFNLLSTDSILLCLCHE